MRSESYRTWLARVSAATRLPRLSRAPGDLSYETGQGGEAMLEAYSQLGALSYGARLATGDSAQVPRVWQSPLAIGLAVRVSRS